MAKDSCLIYDKANIARGTGKKCIIPKDYEKCKAGETEPTLKQLLEKKGVKVCLRNLRLKF